MFFCGWKASNAESCDQHSSIPTSDRLRLQLIQPVNVLTIVLGDFLSILGFLPEGSPQKSTILERKKSENRKILSYGLKKFTPWEHPVFRKFAECFMFANSVSQMVQLFFWKSGFIFVEADLMGKKLFFAKTLSSRLKKFALLSGSFGIKLLAALSFENSVSQMLPVNEPKPDQILFKVR